MVAPKKLSSAMPGVASERRRGGAAPAAMAASMVAADAMTAGTLQDIA